MIPIRKYYNPIKKLKISGFIFRAKDKQIFLL